MALKLVVAGGCVRGLFRLGIEEQERVKPVSQALCPPRSNWRPRAGGTEDRRTGLPRLDVSDWPGRASMRDCLANATREARMTTESSMLHVRMDTEMKQKATAALAAMGLTASEAVRLLFHRIAVDQAFPLELKVPNAQTRHAMAEVDEMVEKRSGRFASGDEVLAELEEASGQ